MHPLYDVIANNIKIDIKQMTEEGHDEAALRAELEGLLHRRSTDALLAFQEELWNRPSPPAFPYDEPNDWATISAGFLDAESHTRFRGGESDLRDRLDAAWLGRCTAASSESRSRACSGRTSSAPCSNSSAPGR